jgi:hypothetical protein
MSRLVDDAFSFILGTILLVAALMGPGRGPKFYWSRPGATRRGPQMVGWPPRIFIALIGGLFAVTGAVRIIMFMKKT